GLLHGVGLAAGRWREARAAAGGTTWGSPAWVPGSLHPALQRAATFHFVCLGWLLFRADSLHTVGTMLARLLTAWGPAPAVTPLVLLAVAFGIGVQYIPKGLPERAEAAFARAGTLAQGAALGALLFVFSALGPQGVAPFIYFRF